MSAAPAPNKPCPIRVVVRDEADADGAPIHDKLGDHNDRFFRDWITHTTWWALRNNKSITLYPQD